MSKARLEARARRQPQRPPGADKAQLASAWAAAAHLPKLDAALVEKAKPGGKAQVGAYEVTRVLGEGEFATVYACVCQGAAKVACKAIKKTKVERKGGSILKAKRNIGRVDLEVEALRRLRHEGICRLYEVIQSASYVYCFMEAGDRDLFSFLDGHPRGCPEQIVVAIARIVALALRHCHARGIAHRDVKPENILVFGSPATWGRGDACVKLCDFGLCADISAGHELTDFVGSPGFFTPELFCEVSYKGDRADAWSLGAVVLECVLGHQAFDALWCPPYDALQDPAAFLAGVAKAVGRIKLSGGSLQELVKKLLRVDPSSRFTVTELCGCPFFDLMSLDKDGCVAMLRLTYDHTPRLEEDTVPRRKAFTSRSCLKTGPSGASAPSP